MPTCSPNVGLKTNLLKLEKNMKKHLNLSKSFFFSEVPVPDRRVRNLIGKSRRNSPRKSPRKSPSKSSSKKEKKKKPARPCMFCGQMQAQLKRHVIRKHRSHEQVRAAMQLPKAEQARAFDAIKKRGIYLENVKRIDKSEKLLSLNGTKGI